MPAIPTNPVDGWFIVCLRPRVERPATLTSAMPKVMPEWYYVAEGTPVGPVPLEDLASLISSGRLPTDVLVWRVGLPQWATAASQPEIASRVPPPIPLHAQGATHTSQHRKAHDGDRERGPFRVFHVSGRGSRWEFAAVVVSGLLTGFVPMFIARVASEDSRLVVLEKLAVLAFFICSILWIPLWICSVIRRLHDLGNPTWHVFLLLVPCINFVLLVALLLLPGQARSSPPRSQSS